MESLTIAAYEEGMIGDRAEDGEAMTPVTIHSTIRQQITFRLRAVLEASDVWKAFLTYQPWLRY
jgi:hypothetical protein